MKEGLDLEIQVLLAGWSAFWKKQEEDLRRVQAAMRLNSLPLSDSDRAILEQLALDQERLFTRLEYSRNNFPWGTGPGAVIALARDTAWITLEFRDLAKAFDTASEKVAHAKVSKHLWGCSERTYWLLKIASNLSRDITAVSTKPLDDTLEELMVINESFEESLQEVRAVNQKLEAKVDGLTVKEIAAKIGCSQQAVWKRIEALKEDRLLIAPVTGGKKKQLWSPQEAAIIIANPGRRRRKLKK